MIAATEPPPVAPTPPARATPALAIAIFTLVAFACATPTDSSHWPESLSPGNAVLFSHNQLVIDASCAEIWSFLVAAPKWPQWYANASNVRIADDASRLLEKGSAFTWTTFGIAVRSQVREFEPPVRLAWYGEAEQMTAYHTWLLRPLPTGCSVVTEETNNGPGAIALRRDKPEAIHDGHAQWLAQLKAISERKSH